jgi:genome maintenance exonuclease 1
MQEAGLYSDVLKVAGRVDVVGEYDGKLSIIDFKTSNNNKDRDMVFDYFLQETAYAIMWHELTGEAITDLVILMSVEKGMVPLIFRDTIDKYIEPLLVRIDDFYRNRK